MMKVGIVTTWFERGAAYVSKQFKEALEKSGYQVFIYSRGGEDLTEVKGLEWRGNEVYEGKKVHFPESTYIDLNDFECWLLDNNIDTVLFNEQRWLPPVLLCKKIGIRSGAYIDYYTKETVSSFKFYDFLICNTKRHQSV
ncbi:glycosyl transferase, partial [Vibrio vulnificus]|nr:glycosyl transferase [Vibrio vulnificus]